MIRVGRKADVYEVVPLIVEMIVEAEYFSHNEF